jgi:cobalt-precorrin-5B (C1)-methyltransferase
VAVAYGEDDAYVTKDAGDDPDVTDGIEIHARVEPADSFAIAGGDGVGRFTLPGFDYPPGEPAINKGPRDMIRHNLQALVFPFPLGFGRELSRTGFGRELSRTGEGRGEASSHSPRLGAASLNLHVTISVPNGEAIARRTFNPRLGIEGGISIIGVSGIVKPFSEQAFLDSIRKCMTVAVASGSERVVIHSGGKSERFLQGYYPTLPVQAFVEYGNFIGDTIRMAAAQNVQRLTLGIMLGKAVKLAAGHLDTHSKKVVMDKAFIAGMLHEAGIEVDLEPVTLARELWTMVPQQQLQSMADAVITRCQSVCKPLLPQGKLTILLISDEGEIYSLSTRTESD